MTSGTVQGSHPHVREGAHKLLEVRHVSKQFPGVQALDDVSLIVGAGTVHALVGENGAGKSTLMKILIGWHRRDGGTITINGEAVDFVEPKQALRAGVSIIEQELSPVGEMTVAENIFLGREPRQAGLFVDYRRLNAMADEVLAKLQIDLEPSRTMKTLTIAQMQLVEIAKAISHESEIVIMDEPTSALGDHEVALLMETIRMLTARGTGVIYISHKLEEVFEIADEITVLRDGKLIGTVPASSVTRDDLIRMMVGREVQGFPKANVPTSEPLLEVEGLSRAGEFQDVGFTLHHGEILGIFGLMGAGKSEVLSALFGVTRSQAGSIRLEGQALRLRQPSDAMQAGLALITEDRKRTGLIMPMSVRDNVSISTLERVSRLGVIGRRKVRRNVGKVVKDLDVRMASQTQLVKYLSGGNQQKVVIGRWLLTEPAILLLDEPTRGIDVGAKREIYRFMSEFVGRGHGVVLVSSELPEILGMSDRIIVLKNGRVTGEVQREEASEESVMQLAV